MIARDESWIPPAQTVPEAIAWWAEATPEAPALLDVAGNTVSFSQLRQRMESFVRWLTTHGVGHGDRVMLALPDGITTAIAGLAVMRMGVGIPVNPAQLLPEIAPVLTAVEPRVVIVARGAATAFREAAAQVGVPALELTPDLVPELELELDLDFDLDMAAAATSESDREAAGRAVVPIQEPRPDDLALILLTSGTTDRPRRVPVTHRNMLGTCAVRVYARRLTPRDRGLSSAPAYFVLGLARVVESLISGGSAIVTNAAAVVLQPEAIRDLQPTWAWMSPAVLETVLGAARNNPIFAQWPLRFARCGGAQVTPDLIARAQALWRVPVLNGYGTTETLGFIAAEESPESIPRKPGSVGLVRPGLEIAIRDADGATLPAGVVGEITARGNRVFSGYVDDPEATAAAFYPGGWYRTGDLGYLDEDSYLFVAGRSREMINRGGEKVAPHEIDDVLRAHPAVADAAAFALPDPRLGEEVAAAVVVRAGATVNERSLRRWMAQRLSLHKVPRRIWFVDALPKTGTGKFQRGELSHRFGGQSAVSGGSSGPETACGSG